MRPLLLGIALVLVAGTASAQRSVAPVLTPSSAAIVPISFASSTLIALRADAVDQRLPAPLPMPRAEGTNDGMRILYILGGAVIGGGLVYAGVHSMDCKDCQGSAATYGAIGGAVVGGFIGSTVYSFRRRKVAGATTP